MKTFFTTLIALVIFTSAARAQLAIQWSTIDGGGGTSSGGAYTLSGTIGQPGHDSALDLNKVLSAAQALSRSSQARRRFGSQPQMDLLSLRGSH